MSSSEESGGDRAERRVPYVHGRDLVPIRRQPTRFVNHRHHRLFAEEDRLRARIEELDRQLVALTEERRELLARIGHVHEELRPSFDGARGRRRRAVVDEEPLPPTVERPTMVWGRELRAICLALLSKARQGLTLRQLHALLHRAGYAIAHAHPVKVLADALGHEVDVGRATRLRRATYAVAGGASARQGWSTLPDW